MTAVAPNIGLLEAGVCANREACCWAAGWVVTLGDAKLKGAETVEAGRLCPKPKPDEGAEVVVGPVPNPPKPEVVPVVTFCPKRLD